VIALINSTEKFKSKTKFSNLVTLFKQKIEDCIINNKLIIISASSSYMEFRNTMSIDDYEYDEENFYLNNGNFELHLKMDDVEEIKYDNTYDEHFTFFLHNNEIEVCLYFLQSMYRN